MEAPPSPASAAPKRPSLVSRHSSSSHTSQTESGPALPRPGPARPHKHVVHSRMGGRNPSFHRSLSKIKITPAHAVVDDDGPPTPKAKHHRRTASSGPSTPASLVPPSPGARPGHNMKRTNTSLALPRTGSQTTLKKNYSSGQLPRLGSSRNISHQGHAHKTSRQERPDIRRAYTQPYKRHKSPAPDHKRRPSVHFNVGSDEDEEGAQAMEGVDDVWTEDSASASPNTTRDNTRNNTRQNSIVLDPAQNPYAQNLDSRPEEKPPDSSEAVAPSPERPNPLASNPRTRDFAAEKMAQQHSSHQQALQHHQRQQQANHEDEGDEEEDDDNDEVDEDEDEDEEVDDDEEEDEEEQEQEEQEQEEQEQEQEQELDEDHQQLQELQRHRHELVLRQQIQHQQEQQQREQQQRQSQQSHDQPDDEQEPEMVKTNEQYHHNHQQQQQQQPHSPPPSSLHTRPLDTELISKRLLEKKAPAPPRVSSISALANAASADPKSLSQSQNGNLAPTGANNTPVVSRFVEPDNDGIGSKDATPRNNQSGFLRSHSRTSSISHTLQNQDTTNLQRNRSAPNFANSGIQSPTTGTPSGARTPDTALNNSRTQQKLWLQRGLSNIEASSTPHLPALLPTGRAQAMRTPQKGLQFEFVDKEYAVVRRFHNTLLQGVERLRVLNGGTLPGRPAKLPSSASTTAVNGNGAATGGEGAKRPGTARSMRSVKSNISVGATNGGRESANQRAKVSFHTGASPESGRQSPADDDDDHEDSEDERHGGRRHHHHQGGESRGGKGGARRERVLTASDIARRMWEGDVGLAAQAA